MIFENELYKNKEILIVTKLMRYENKISKLELSKRLDIPYATFYRLDEENFISKPKILDDIKNIFNITEIYNFEELEAYSDERLLDYLYSRNTNIVFKNNNSIEKLQALIFELIESDFKNINVYNELELIKEYLNPIHTIIYEIAYSIINKKPIKISKNNKYIEILTAYIKIKHLFKMNNYVDFLLIKDYVFKLLYDNLMINKAFEIKLYEACILFKLNRLTNKNLLMFIKNDIYINEVNILKALLLIKANKIDDSFGYIIKITTVEKNLILRYLSKNTNYYLDDIKRVNDELLKSNIYDFVKRIILL